MNGAKVEYNMDEDEFREKDVDGKLVTLFRMISAQQQVCAERLPACHAEFTKLKSHRWADRIISMAIGAGSAIGAVLKIKG
jgi:hypothetical protein